MTQGIDNNGIENLFGRKNPIVEAHSFVDGRMQRVNDAKLAAQRKFLGSQQPIKLESLKKLNFEEFKEITNESVHSPSTARAKSLVVRPVSIMCYKCGAKRTLSSKFCGKCGAKSIASR